MLDTDIAIELLRGRNVQVAGQLGSRDRNMVYLSTVTVAELMFGAMRRKEAEKSVAICRLFCSAFQLVDINYAAAERSSFIRANLEGRGERIGAYDVLIAGIASACGYVLVTHIFANLGALRGFGSKTAWQCRAC